MQLKYSDIYDEVQLICDGILILKSIPLLIIDPPINEVNVTRYFCVVSKYNVL